jgi:hypothetical protein
MEGKARRSRLTVGTLIAVLGLVVTMVFNTVGVWQGVAQTKRDRVASELGLLTQLNGLARQAEGRLTGVRESVCSARRPRPRDGAALIEAAQYYEYLAWLFNAGHVTMSDARRYWAPSMIQTYELFATIGLTEARRRFPELNAFKLATPRDEWPPLPADDC